MLARAAAILLLVAIAFPGCAFSARDLPGTEPSQAAAAVEAELANDDPPPYYNFDLPEGREQLEDGGIAYHAAYNTGGWHVLVWFMTFGLYMPFPPSLDVIVRSRGNAGTSLAVRVREHFQILFLFPCIYRDEESEERFLEDVAQRLR